MSGFENEIIVAKGIDLTGSSPPNNQLGTDGYLLIGNSSGDPQGAPITSADGSVTITNGSGTIDLSVSTSGNFTWNKISASQALENNNGYICGSGATLSLSLPSSAAVGTTIEVMVSGASGWKITQGAGQRITIGGLGTTLGVAGYVQSTDQGDWIRLVCTTSGTIWTGSVQSGNLTIV